MTEPAPYHERLVEPLLNEYFEQLPALFVTGPRAAGKSTTLNRKVTTVIRLDREAEAAAFVADPDVALRGLKEPVLLDEWQNVRGVLGAVRRAVEKDPRPGRYLVTGSVNAELENQVWPGTGRLTRLPMWPMTVRERLGRLSGSTFFDTLSAGQNFSVPAETPDLEGYVDLALASGFPHACLNLSGRPREAWLDSYIVDLLTHDVEQVEDAKREQRRHQGETTRRKRRDYQRLRQYFDAYALSSAGVPDDKTLYNAAGIKRDTALIYEALFEDLFVTERVPAWASNRLKRLVLQPKRYLIDPALISAALRISAEGIIRDGDLLGRFLDTFVAAQLRPEATVAKERPRLFHLRTKNTRQEVDIIGALGAKRIIGVEVKADSAPNKHDARHLIWLRNEQPEGFIAGVLFHTGPRIFELDERIIALPISALWG